MSATAIAATAVGNPLALFAKSADDRETWLISGNTNAAYRINMKTGAYQSVPLQFEPHSFAHHPNFPMRVWAISKWNKYSAEIDFERASVSRLLINEEMPFEGHAAYSHAGETLYISQVDLRSGSGCLVAYDAKNGKKLSILTVAPGEVHDCQTLPDHTSWITSSGIKRLADRGPNSGPRVDSTGIFRVDLNNGQILDKKYIDLPEQIIGHFGLCKDGTMIALTTPLRDHSQAGRIYWSHLGKGPLLEIALPGSLSTQLKQEMLSIAIDDSRHVACISNPGGGLTLWIDTRNGKHLGHTKHKSVGIALDQSKGRFLYTAGRIFEEEASSFKLKVVQLPGMSETTTLASRSAHILAI